MSDKIPTTPREIIASNLAGAARLLGISLALTKQEPGSVTDDQWAELYRTHSRLDALARSVGSAHQEEGQP